MRRKISWSILRKLRDGMIIAKKGAGTVSVLARVTKAINHLPIIAPEKVQYGQDGIFSGPAVIRTWNSSKSSEIPLADSEQENGLICENIDQSYDAFEKLEAEKTTNKTIKHRTKKLSFVRCFTSTIKITQIAVQK